MIEEVSCGRLEIGMQNKYAVYFRLNDAKKPETRVRRIAKFVGMFERGEKFH